MSDKMAATVVALAQRISRDTDLSVELIGKGANVVDLYKAASDLLNNASYYFTEYVAHADPSDHAKTVENLTVIEDLLRTNKIIA